MPKYEVTFVREWYETGRTIVEADTVAAAREEALELLNDDDESIKWESENMDPQGQWIEDVTDTENL